MIELDRICPICHKKYDERAKRKNKDGSKYWAYCHYTYKGNWCLDRKNDHKPFILSTGYPYIDGNGTYMEKHENWTYGEALKPRDIPLALQNVKCKLVLVPL